MKQKRVIYGVYGMMEYQAVIKVGRSTMKVQFSDGTVTAVGVNPATFSTDNLMVQTAIEMSDQFKRGLIKRVSVAELEKEVKIIRAAEEPANAPAPPTAAAEDAVTAEETEAAETPAVTGEEQAKTDMEFACNDDAKDYLEEHFGAVRSKLRNRADIIAFASERGINITFAV